MDNFDVFNKFIIIKELRINTFMKKTPEHILVFAAILPDGNGDFANMLNLTRALKDHYPTCTISVIVICIQNQHHTLKNIARGINNLEIEYRIAPEVKRVYQQGDLYHYNCIGPGKVTLTKKHKQLINNADAIIEFPFAYPYTKKLLADATTKTTHIIEYGRSAQDRNALIHESGLHPEGNGILFVSKTQFNMSSVSLNNIALLQRMMKKKAFTEKDLESYTQQNIITPLYVKRTAFDPQNKGLLHLVIAMVILNKTNTKNIHLICSEIIEKVHHLDAIFYESNIKEIHYHNPKKESVKHLVLYENLPVTVQQKLKNQSKPKKTLHFWSGFSCSQNQFHALLCVCARSTVKYSENDPQPIALMGACGDGSLTDTLSVNYYFPKARLFPILIPRIDYHQDTFKGLINIATGLEVNPYLVIALEFTTEFHQLNDKKLLAFCNILKDDMLWFSLQKTLNYIYNKHNLMTYIKKQIAKTIHNLTN